MSWSEVLRPQNSRCKEDSLSLVFGESFVSWSGQVKVAWSRDCCQVTLRCHLFPIHHFVAPTVLGSQLLL